MEMEIMRILPLQIRRLFERLDMDWDRLQEIRLRVHKPVILQYGEKELFLSGHGFLTGEQSLGYVTGGEEMKEAVEYISNYSRYAYEEEMGQGYITIRGGHRVGLAGQLVRERGATKGMKYISCINIRLAHEVIGCGTWLLPYLQGEQGLYNTLLVSPPRGGKTTLLRDLIRLLSDGEGMDRAYTVGVVDERSEIGACFRGIPQNTLGCRTDILDGCPKAEGMMLLVRSMAPEVIAVDEIGSEDDMTAMEYAMHCGVHILATIHGADWEELQRKSAMVKLFREQFFGRYVVLGHHPGMVQGIYDGAGTPLCGPCKALVQQDRKKVV
ncbi:MAG: stage III sporulation protein AA [Lachnospiraceae bacterium]|nr:stage III sporulation protein AA [Lachnospiraceae bacterium]